MCTSTRFVCTSKSNAMMVPPAEHADTLHTACSACKRKAQLSLKCRAQQTVEPYCMLVFDIVRKFTFAAHDEYSEQIPDKPNQQSCCNKHLLNRTRQILKPHIIIKTQFDTAKISAIQSDSTCLALNRKYLLSPGRIPSI